MEIHFRNRDELREWLKKYGASEKELWIRFYKKHTGIECVPYGDAVEESLCFGWIDGKIKSINDEYYIQRYTPRNPKSGWSRSNIARMEKMISQGKAEKPGLDAYQVLLSKPELAYNNRSSGDPVIPEDLLAQLSVDETALSNFNNFPPSARRLYIDWLNSAKKAGTRPGRIAKIVGFAKLNKKPGMM